MKKFFVLFLFLNLKFALFTSAQVLSYTFSVTTATFVANAGTVLLGGGTDEALSPSIPISFTFKFGCTTYTHFIVSDNGWLGLDPNCTFSDGVNDLPGSLPGNGASQQANFERPLIAALWDDLGVDNTGSVNYKRTGSTPNRVLTVEWNKMWWRAASSVTGVTFQIKLYETSSTIEFIYKLEGGALSSPTASIGLAGVPLNEFYALNNASASPTASKASDPRNISTKPANNQVYRWVNNCVTPLPIELISFKGKNIERGNFLEWETASETNNKIFILERSNDGENFEAIYNIKGKGNSSSISKYNYLDTDLSPSSSHYYYRLKQTDFDGIFSYSNIINVTINSLFEKKVYLYFDNNMNSLTIKYRPYGAENIDVIIHDVSGRILYEHSHEVSEEKSTIPISLSSLTSGLYIVKISGNNVLFQSKFIR